MTKIQEKGTLKFKGEIIGGTSKNGNEWQKQTIVIEADNRSLAIDAMTDGVAELAKYSVGDEVVVEYAVYSREWNGKWYSNVNLVSITGTAKPAPAPAPQVNELEPKDGDLPF